MKSKDTVKIVVAVVLLAIAGVVIALQFSGERRDPGGQAPPQDWNADDYVDDPERPVMMLPVPND